MINVTYSSYYIYIQIYLILIFVNTALQGRNSMKWVVVKFIDGKDFSVIPTNWLVETDLENLSKCSVKYCKWPPIRVTSDDLKFAEDPDDSWKLYKIKVLDGNKTYGKIVHRLYLNNY